MNPKRRAHFLLISIIIVALIGATLAVGGRSYHALAVRTKLAENDAAAAQLVASARLWIRQNPDRIAAMTPGETLALDVSEAFAGSTAPLLEITRDDDANIIRIRARLKSGRHAAQLSVVVPLTEIDE